MLTLHSTNEEIFNTQMHELTNLIGDYHKKVKLEKVHSRTHRRYVTSEITKIGSMPGTGGWFHL